MPKKEEKYKQMFMLFTLQYYITLQYIIFILKYFFILANSSYFAFFFTAYFRAVHIWKQILLGRRPLCHEKKFTLKNSESSKASLVPNQPLLKGSASFKL